MAIFLLLLAVAASGCTTKSSARAQAREAYLQGQVAGMSRAQAMSGERAQTQAQADAETQAMSVTVVGPVKNSIVPWMEGLTLAKLIVAAEYLPTSDPREITVVRAGQKVPVDPKRLLNGEDAPLLPGDIVELHP
jgi:hypothetical protein